MTAPTFPEFMAQRMALVEQLSALNSKQLSNTQMRSGIEVELLACNEAIERDGETASLLAQRAELETRLSEAIAACTDCDRRLDALTDQLDALDQQQAGPAP